MEDLAVHPLSFFLAGMAELGGAALPLQEPLVKATEAVFQKKKNSKHSAPPQSLTLELSPLSPFVSSSHLKEESKKTKI